jgi:immunity protein 26 of polymorphic toxin system
MIKIELEPRIMKLLHKPGTFLRIPLPDGTFGYARVVDVLFDAFYKYRTTEPDADLDRIASKPILFKLTVTAPPPKSWEVIGWRELEERLLEPVVQFHKEVGPLGRCSIYDNLGNEREATLKEGIGLEPALIWGAHSVEERLLDAFMGRPNAVLERIKREWGIGTEEGGPGPRGPPPSPRSDRPARGRPPSALSRSPRRRRRGRA